MHTFPGIDYFALGRQMDVSSWDNYPQWRGDDRDVGISAATSFKHDLMRGVCGQKPFLMMESCPGAVNWDDVNTLPPPGTVLYQSMQAIAHGSDSVQYFQFRKGRGSSEQYHGAIIGHDNSDKTRIFREVSEVGQTLKDISEVCGSAPESKVALIYNWDNTWILDQAMFGDNRDKKYIETIKDHYAAWKSLGYDVLSRRRRSRRS